MLSLAASHQEPADWKERPVLCEYFVKLEFNEGKQDMKLVLSTESAFQMLELCDCFQSFTVYILITDSV